MFSIFLGNIIHKVKGRKRKDSLWSTRFWFRWNSEPKFCYTFLLFYTTAVIRAKSFLAILSGVKTLLFIVNLHLITLVPGLFSSFKFFSWVPQWCRTDVCPAHILLLWRFLPWNEENSAGVSSTGDTAKSPLAVLVGQCWKEGTTEIECAWTGKLRARPEVSGRGGNAG